jgi:hypothetical protein
MRRLLLLGICCLTIPSLGIAQPVALPGPEAAQWLNHVLPLPQEVSLTATVSVPRAQVRVTMGPGLGDIAQTAALGELFKTPPAEPAFEIVMGLVDPQGQLLGHQVPDAARLATLPNSRQAYLIRPDGPQRLLVAAHHPHGVFYGSRTLLQLFLARRTDTTVTIPIGTVTDWPDLEERGLWNFPLPLIPWLAEMKLNFAKIPTHLEKLERGKPARIKPVDQQFLADSRARAFNPVLTSTHLNFLHLHGLNEAYPELVGKGEKARCPYKYKIHGALAPCASNPLLQQFIADWLREAGRQGGEEVSVWLTEFYAQCECEPCLKSGQFQLETRATLAAFEEVQREFPRLKLRIFFTLRRTPVELQATRECLAMLPPGVKVELVYGTTDAYQEAAAKGVWVGDYGVPYLTRGGYVGLTTYPTWMQKYLQLTQERKYQGVYAISYLYTSAAYHQALLSQQISALAEWSWNLKGRDVRQFAVAWATRNGLPQPEKVADWVVLMDTDSSMLIQSAQNIFGDYASAATALREGKPLPLGGNLLWAFPRLESFTEHADRTRQALALAEEIGAPALVLESQYGAQLGRVLRTLYDLTAAAADQRGARFAELQQQVEALNSLFIKKVDLLHCEPADFAPKMKAEHRSLWDKRLQSFEEAMKAQ